MTEFPKLENTGVDVKWSARSDGVRQSRYYNLLRWLCVALILLAVLQQPVSHVGLDHNWSDQSKFYEALNAALKGTANPLVDEGWVGPGYVGAAVALNRIVSIRAEDTLVLLNRLCYLGTIAVVAIFVLFLWRPVEPDRRQARLFVFIGFGYLLCVIDATGLTFFSDVPWSHFVSSFLIVLTMALVLAACRVQSRAVKATLLVAAGLSLGALVGVRLFDGLVVAVGLLIAYGVRALRSTNINQAIRIFMIGSSIMAISGFAIFAECLVLSGAKRIPLFYLSIKTLPPALTKLYPSTFFPKFYQIFVDPSFHTSDQPLVFRSALQITWLPNFGDWNMPILLQSPILLYALAIFLPVVVCIFVFRRKDASAEATALKAMLIIAPALLIGYTTTFAAGSPHLIFGEIRDYMPIIWCLVLIGAPSAGRLWVPKPSTRVPAILLSACILILVLGQCAAAYGVWPIYRSRHIAQTIVQPQCRAGQCTLSVTFINPNGDRWSDRTDMLFTQINCAGKEEDLTLVGPEYRFPDPECSGPAGGVVLPRLTGLVFVPTDRVPVGFRFQLPQKKPVDRSGRTYAFGTGAGTHYMLTTGWSGDEHGYVWSDARRAQIDIPYQSQRRERLDVDLELTPFLAGTIRRQTVIMSLGDNPPQQFVLSKNLEHIHLSQVIGPSGNLRISMRLPDAVSPSRLGVSPDPRLLAVALQQITISTAPAK